MEEEVDDYINYQADSLPTGSISFGRFEMETLSWERRSSFSHNRYLEEVEKYSTPGSVTGKKAYFEAHFKKKGFRHQSSRGNQKDAENHSKDSNPGGCSGLDISSEYLDDGPFQIDNAPTVSDEQEMNYREYTAPEIICGERRMFDCDTDEGHQIQCGNVTLPALEDKEQLALEEKAEDGSFTVKEPLDNPEISSNSLPTQEKTTLVAKNTKGSLTKVKKIVEKPTGKAKPETSHKNTEKLGKVDKESACVRQSEKRPLRITPQSSVAKSVKPESSGKLKAYLGQDNGSEKGLNLKKGVALPHPTDEKGDIATGISTNSSLPATGSVKEEVKQTTKIFNFKSDERAEKRKEFNMKLEEKIHAKEAEMNQIQARTQEETEAEIKQLRKSLNFKATPMPSFYRESMTRAPDGKKLATASARSSKLQSKNSACRTLSIEKCPSLSAVVNQVPSIGEEKSSPHLGPLITSGGDNGSPVVMNEADKADECQASVSAKKIEAVKKDEKIKLTIQQQLRDGSGKKGERFTSHRNVGKMLKGIAGGSVTVRVAS